MVSYESYAVSGLRPMCRQIRTSSSHSELSKVVKQLLRTHIIAMVKNMVGGGDEVDGDTPLMEHGTSDSKSNKCFLHIIK